MKKNIDKKGTVSHFLQSSFISSLVEDSRILIAAFKLLRYPTWGGLWTSLLCTSENENEKASNTIQQVLVFLSTVVLFNVDEMP